VQRELAELSQRPSTESQVNDTHRSELSDRLQQLHDSTLRRLDELESHWERAQHRLRQTLDEQHQQRQASQAEQQRQRETLELAFAEAREQRDALAARLTDAHTQLAELEKERQRTERPDDPWSEVKRLSEALAQANARQARQRDELYRRIEQLRSAPSLARAA
jgi:hypothetical protein